MAITFYTEDLDFQLPHPRKTTSWIKNSIKRERREVAAVEFVFCSDEFLLDLNIRYLHHSTLTDVITFDYSETSKALTGEIFISVDRVKENALKFKRTLDDELHRVMIHGILHLVGYNDKNSTQRAEMRKKEEAYLSLR